MAAKKKSALTKPNTAENKEIKKQSRMQALFIKEYLIDLNGTQAAIRAGYSEQTARVTASQLLAKPDVRDQVEKAMAARAIRVEVTAEKVLQRWWDLANADPNELVEVRRGACRYCYGKDHRYQRTPRELREVIAQFERDRLAAEAMGKSYAATFDQEGGAGFDPRRDPAKNCPECFGEGQARDFVKDTRDLSPAGRMLFAGVKSTKDGVEIKQSSRDEALKLVAQHIGMFKTRVVHGNDPDNPMPSSPGAIIVPAKDIPT